MSRIYTNTHRIKFTSISESYQVEKSCMGKLSPLYSHIIVYATKHYDGTKRFKTMVVRALNLLTYYVYAAEPLPFDWSIKSPFDNMPDVSEDLVREMLNDIYLTIDSIEWDLDVDETTQDAHIVEKQSKPVANSVPVIKTPLFSEKSVEANAVPLATHGSVETPASDLYIQCPEIPQFDVNKVWLRQQCGSDILTIYTTLPEIPRRQRDISVTTDVNKMGSDDLMALFPNRVIPTRANIMYQQQPNLPFDEILGVLLPIGDYTKEQLIDNLIKYPHFYKLVREDFESFYAYVEIDGELKNTMDVWDFMDISKKIPKNAEFIKEYLVRKYLLDRDIEGEQANYPMLGTLNPFLTLFMPASEYEKRGYDPLEIARQCVMSRVSYKQSRNPILRRLRESSN